MSPFEEMRLDDRYTKYFKMLRLGVPTPQVKHKMAMEGIDGSILDQDPESPSPNAGSIAVVEE